VGLLRTLLALAVLIGHAGGLYGAHLCPGNVAVQGFYVVSGFYMSLVLDTKYPASKSGTWLFYRNRYLRLWPTYFVVLVLTFIAVAAGHGLYETTGADWARLDAVGKLWLGFTNISAVGQDTVMYMGVRPDTGHLYFLSDFHKAAQPAYHLLLVPQAWTLGLELAFYALAPFLLRTSWRWRLGLVAASVGLRLVMVNRGLSYDPWTYRFFPTELALFLAGSMAYQLYKDAAWVRGRPYQWAALILSILVALSFSYLPIPIVPRMIGFYVLLMLGVPGIFSLTRKWKWDTFIGELSYPIYLCHIILLELVWKAGSHRTILAMVGAIVFSVVIVRFVEAPIDRYRQRRVRAA
jgi:peptidoglycan/LPS O-acetylase OafA/YrhL